MKVKPSEYKQYLGQSRIQSGPANCLGKAEPTPPRVLQIPDALSSLECACEELGKALCELESRLRLVLSAPATPDANKIGPSPEGTEIGQRIRKTTSSIYDAKQFVEDLLSRLEL